MFRYLSELYYSDRSRRLGFREGSFDKKPKMNTSRNTATTILTTIFKVAIDRLSPWMYFTILYIIADDRRLVMDFNARNGLILTIEPEIDRQSSANPTIHDPLN
jgi:hypothetical protein